MPEQLRVAIIGGGIGGLTLAKALQLQPNGIVFDVFESKSLFSERGASVSLAPNALNVLRAVGMDIDKMLRECEAAPSEDTEAIGAVGDHRGAKLWTIAVDSFSVVRTQWLDQLLHGLPSERLHSNKKLVSIDENTAGHTLHFADGTMHEADVVVGCDGIHSKIRAIILGEENRKVLDPVFAGYWDARTILPLDKAITGLRSSLFDAASVRQRMLVGKGSYMLLIPHELSKTYFIVAAGSAQEGHDFGKDKDSWKTELSREFLDEAYEDWDEPLKSTVIDNLMSKDPSSGPDTLFSEWESAPTPTYHRNNICMLGDAAHSFLPWTGQGAGMASEDACVLASILGAVQSRGEVSLALKAFDQMCRGRPTFVIECARNAAKLSVGGYGLDPAAVAALGNPTGWWTDVCQLDMKAHLQEAVEVFKGLKKSA